MYFSGFDNIKNTNENQNIYLPAIHGDTFRQPKQWQNRCNKGSNKVKVVGGLTHFTVLTQKPKQITKKTWESRHHSPQQN